MVHENYDFTRNPIVKDHAFFLESKCIRCGFIVSAPFIEQLIEEEKRHGTECASVPRQILSIDVRGL